MSITRRVALVTAMATLTASLSVGVAAADTDPSTDGTGDVEEAIGPDQELGALIADTLRALGVEPSAIEEIVAAVGHGASLRLGVMLDDGVVTEDQLDALSEHVEEGTLPADIDQVVEETRARRDAFREAAEDLLETFGVDLDPDQPVRDVLVDNEIDPDEFIARLDEELPPPPRHGDDEPETPPEPTYPSTPAAAPTPTTAPPPTTTTPPAPTTSTTTIPAAPDPAYPTPTPPASQPPTGDYPTHEPAPAPEQHYPEAGGGAGEGGAEGEESY